MAFVSKILPYVEIVLSVLIVTAVLLQQSGASLGGAFGGDGGSFHHTRRGFEYFLFVFTIVCSILFVASTLVAVLIQ